MGETTVKYLGHNEGHMISKLEENLGDTDIKNFTVSPLYQIKCIHVVEEISLVVSSPLRNLGTGLLMWIHGEGYEREWGKVS